MGVAARDDLVSAPQRRAVGHRQPRRRLGRHVHVHDAGHALVGEQRRRATRLPDQGTLHVGPGLDGLERVHAHVRRDRGLLADRALVADHGPLGHGRVRADLAVLADQRPPHLGARAQVGVGVDHGELDLGLLLHDHVVAEHRVAADRGGLVDRAVVADHGRALDALHLLDQRSLAHPYVLAQPHPGHLQLDLSVERVPVGLLVLDQVPDVLPVALGHEPVQGRALLQQAREQLLREVVRDVGRDLREHLRLEHVDPRVDRVGEHLAPRRLFQEALDPAVLGGDHHAELERVGNALQRDRRDRALVAVELDQRREVHVGERIAAHHQARLVEVVLEQLHAARRPGGHLLHRVLQIHAEVGSLPEVAADHLRHVRERRDRVGDPVPADQLQDVLHARLSGNGHHRLWLVGGQRSEASPLPTGHHDGLHEADFRRCSYMGD